ncbi:VIT domain-containing protein [Chitinimonas sp. JJ19]|uniref:VIT domain-containing protein n=1 Tax=Chitinimonas sp. JJ19 TaxID=3109352 RepID=UPI003003544F
MSHALWRACLAGLATTLLLAATPPVINLPMPQPFISGTRANEVPIQLKQLDVRVRVAGSQAETTLDMTFHNPNGRQLEGNLQFPLLPHQQIAGFALDIDGAMRPAVPVEKAKGREVFDSIERRQVDPALLESTAGNFFRLRIYPIPAQGERRVQIRISESIPRDGQQYSYRLPLDHFNAVADFHLAIDLPSRQAPSLQGALTQLQFKPSAQGYSAVLDRDNFTPRGQLQLQWPTAAAPTVYRQSFDGEHFFVAELPVADTATPRALPRQIGLLWDSSSSGARRQHAAELALLDRYFAAMGNGEVRLVRLRDRAEAVQHFRIVNGNWEALRSALQATQYDGATALDGWHPHPGTAEYLLFSDGLANYGSGSFPKLGSHQRLYAIDSSNGGDSTRLGALASLYGGRAIQLGSAQDVPLAAKKLLNDEARIVGLAADSAEQLVAASPYAEDGLLRIAGRLRSANDTLRIKLLLNGQASEQRIALRTDAPDHPHAASLWARYRIAQLGAEPQLNRGEITRLGKRFSLVTAETSLLVLDNVDDYARYDITPPADYLPRFEKIRAGLVRMRVQARTRQLEDVVREFQEKISWWEQAWPKGKPPRPKPAKRQAEAEMGTAGMAAEMAGAPPMAAAAPMPAPAPAMAARSKAVSAVADDDGATPAHISIALKPWQANAPYARRLRAATSEQRYQIYLDEKPSYLNSSAFYLDAADIFLDKGQRDLALRILSNLAEMDLENRQVLRILGYRLLQAGAPELAVPVFERVRQMAEEEPQSFRDLGLAYAAQQRHQDAIDTLYEVITRPWDDRFAEVELIALAELNAIVANAPTKLDTRQIDGRLLRNLPLDIRAVLTWDADNSDMDLWVTDPNGEKCYYAHRLTYQGGRMSRDFTGGYGPEEFSLKQAKPGKYKIEANFYGQRQQVLSGETTLQLKLTTGFGKASAKEQMITLRLKGESETVFVGEFEVAAKSGK